METLRALAAAVSEAVKNPMANIVTSVILLAVVITLALILIMLMLLALLPAQRKVVKVRRVRRTSAPQEQAAPDLGVRLEPSLDEQPALPPDDSSATEPTPAARRWGRYSVGLGAVVLILAFASAYYITGTDSFCASTCHRGQVSVQQAVDVSHASCVECHERAVPSGLAENAFSRARMAYLWLTRGDSDPHVVDSSACLGCHESITTTLVQSKAIRMSHREVVDGGYPCGTCHQNSGHTVKPSYRMSDCVVCHDSVKASSACATCHRGDPYTGVAIEGTNDTNLTEFPLTRIQRRDCGGCHDQARECDSCHGLRMPHDQEFISGGHARVAAFEKKALCYKCHLPESCSTGCHIGFPGHGDNWKKDHQSSPWDAGCMCHSARSGRTGPMCPLCH